MSAATRSYRLARGLLCGLGGFGALSYLQLLVTGDFSPWLLPLALLLGGLGSWRLRSPSPFDPLPTPRWLSWSCVVVILGVIAAIAYGAVATPARHWDSAVAWEVKADFLSDAPTITQPFFARAEVFHHSRGYPLLQPLTVAAGNLLLGPGLGRLLFPLLLATLAMAVGATVALRAERRWLGPLAAVAVVVTPALVNPSAGSADSGYGELFLATCVAAATAGLVLRDRWLLAAALATAVLVKPEGSFYGLLLLVVLWARRDRGTLITAALVWALAASLGIAVLQRVNGTESWLALLAAPGVAVAAIGSDRLLARLSTRARALSVLVILPVALIALPAMIDTGAGVGTAFDSYLANSWRPIERLARLPAIAWQIFDHAVVSLRFGATFALLALACVLRRIRRQPLDAATWWTLVGIAAITVPFLLSPEQDLTHHAKSSMNRFLLHWLGAAWIVAGLGLASGLSIPQRPREGKRALLINHVAPPHIGGVEQLVQMEAEALIDAGWEVTWVTSDAGGDGETPPEHPALRIVRVPAWHFVERRFGIAYPMFSPRLLSTLWREVGRADFVHLHGLIFGGSVVAAPIARLRGRPCLLTDHGGVLTYSSRLATWALRLMIETGGRLTASCATHSIAYNADLQALLQRLGGEHEVSFLANPVDPERFYPPSLDQRRRAREELGWDELPRVLCVGRILPHKGIRQLLAAATQEFRLVFCGPGDPELIAEVRDAGADYLPPRRQIELVSLYQAADVFALPSRNEGFPLVAQEALACGLPVLMSDIPAYDPYRHLSGLQLCDPEPDVLRRRLTEILADRDAHRPTTAAESGREQWLARLLELARS